MRYIEDAHKSEITWEEIWATMVWRIEDVAVFEHLHRNGYHYEDCGAGVWYRVNIPYIGWGGSLPLADGFTLELNGTLMEVIPPELLISSPTQPKESRPKDEHPMQEIWDRVEQEQHLFQRILRFFLSMLAQWSHSSQRPNCISPGNSVCFRSRSDRS